MPHNKKVPGLISSWGRAFLCGGYMIPLCLSGFPSGILCPPTITNMYIRLNPVSALYKGAGLDLEAGPWTPYSSWPLLVGIG